ncbi:MAG: hypothetical protein EOP73_30630, partial [Variovorax sp.]
MPTPTIPMTSLHLVLVDGATVRAAGLAGAIEAPPALRRAVAALDGWRVTVHAGADAFLRARPDPATAIAPADATDAADVRVLLHAPGADDGHGPGRAVRGGVGEGHAPQEVEHAVDGAWRVQQHPDVRRIGRVR